MVIGIYLFTLCTYTYILQSYRASGFLSSLTFSKANWGLFLTTNNKASHFPPQSTPPYFKRMLCLLWTDESSRSAVNVVGLKWPEFVQQWSQLGFPRGYHRRHGDRLAFWSENRFRLKSQLRKWPSFAVRGFSLLVYKSHKNLVKISTLHFPISITTLLHF